MAKWLLLTHQLPAEPSNARVKVWRKLQDLGAVAIKNSIYVLPNRSGTREDFEWLKKEIASLGGEASVFLADSITDMDEKEIVQAFQGARDKDYERFVEETTGLMEQTQNALQAGHREEDYLSRLEKEWTALKMRWERLKKMDFFRAPSEAGARQVYQSAQKVFQQARAFCEEDRPSHVPPISARSLKGRVWVTRLSPHIDRLACAWLVRRYIDPRARFKFVKEPYQAQRREICFDMAEGEFTHLGDWCSFETFVHRLELKEAALADLAEIVHDIDLKDKKFGRLEASGVALIIRGLCRVYKQDQARLEAGMAVFDALRAALVPEKAP